MIVALRDVPFALVITGDEALGAACVGARLDWTSVKTNMRSTGRYQVETYRSAVDS